MGKSKKKYYVVVRGRKPGMYEKWSGDAGAQIQVKDYPDALYKGFFSRDEAVNWIKSLSTALISEHAPDLEKYLEEDTSDAATSPESIERSLKAGKTVIFTDGSVNSSTNSGGYGAVLLYKDRIKELSGGYRETTNNRMELRACVEGLKALKSRSEVILFSDSQYIVNGMTKGWVKKWKANGWMRNKQAAVKNRDLWMELLELAERHKVVFEWVKGHDNVTFNERCDALAKQASRQKNLPVDEQTTLKNDQLDLFKKNI